MTDTLVTLLQLFGIGFGFGVAGPCLLACTPVLIAYIAAGRPGRGEVLRYILAFISGRLSAYVFLGALAGASGAILQHFMGSRIGAYFRPAAGVISIVLGIFVLAVRPGNSILCRCPKNRAVDTGSLFLLGLVIGASPCAPLSMLLLEIALMSKNAFQGMAYASAFGLGTSLSVLIVAGGISGLLIQLPDRLLKQEKLKAVFRIMCAALLILLGVKLVIGI